MDDATVDRLSRYASGFSYDDLPAPVVHQAKRLIVDSIGCALGGFEGEPARIARALAGEFSGARGATILGASTRTSMDWAAFANGTMVRYLDFNDSFAGRDNAHPTDNLAIILAAVEGNGATGKSLISGFVLAYELQAAFADSHKIREAGPWDQAANAAISSVLGISHVMGLDTRRTAEALRLGALQGLVLGQARIGELSHVKASTVALAGRTAITAALLAEQGFTGPPLAMEGPFGFFQGLAGRKIDLLPLAGEGENTNAYRILRAHVKRFPVGFYAQSAIEAALECRQQLGIRGVQDIKRITLETFENAIFAMAGDPARWRPKTRESADHSLPFVIAMALRDGRVDTDQFVESNLDDPAVLDLMDRVTVEHSAQCQAAWPDAILNIVTVKTVDGRTCTAEVPYHIGHAKRPMTDRDIEAKFRSLCGISLSAAQQDRALAMLWQVQDIVDWSDFFTPLQFQTTQSSSLQGQYTQ